MQTLYDLLPVVAFFVAYKFAGMYAATAVLLAVTVVQVALQWLRRRTVSKMMLISAGVALLFGGATLLIHDDRFIVLKPTVVYVLFGGALLASQWWSEKPFVQRLLEAQLTIDARTWQLTNAAWAMFFLLLAAVNLVFVYGFSRDAWVNWHTATVFVILLFALAQGFWLARRASLAAAPPPPPGSL
jgi:intracellular septation protein